MPADFFLEIVTKKGGKIKGEAQSNAYSGQIEVEKFTIGLTSPSGYDSNEHTEVATGRVQLEHAEFEFESSIASTPLFQTLCTNDVVKTATLSCRRSGAGQGKEATFLQWRLNDARLVSFQMRGEGDNTKDTIKIAYAGVEISYKQQKSDGSTAANMMAAYDAGDNAMVSPTLGS